MKEELAPDWLGILKHPITGYRHASVSPKRLKNAPTKEWGEDVPDYKYKRIR